MHSFINQYIFPGGYLPSTTQLLNHVSAQSQGSLIVEGIENIGGHYAKTLRLWNEQFQYNFHDKIKPALLSRHPGMSKDAIEVFRRKWEVIICRQEQPQTMHAENADCYSIISHIVRLGLSLKPSGTSLSLLGGREPWN